VLIDVREPAARHRMDGDVRAELAGYARICADDPSRDRPPVSFLLRVLLAWVVVALAFLVTTRLVPGIQVHGGVGAYLVVAAVFGLVNGILGPVLRLLTLPISILTLGIFLLVLNALLLALSAWLVPALTIDGFWSAFVGAILLGLVSWALNHLLAGPLERALRPR
jgi:putative membrane protein